MTLFDFLGPAAGSGATLSAVIGFATLGALVAAKYWQDRDLSRPQMAERRELRNEAKEQASALGHKQNFRPDHKQFGPGKGEFAKRNRSEGGDLS